MGYISSSSFSSGASVTPVTGSDRVLIVYNFRGFGTAVTDITYNGVSCRDFTEYENIEATAIGWFKESDLPVGASVISAVTGGSVVMAAVWLEDQDQTTVTVGGGTTNNDTYSPSGVSDGVITTACLTNTGTTPALGGDYTDDLALSLGPSAKAATSYIGLTDSSTHNIAWTAGGNRDEVVYAITSPAASSDFTITDITDPVLPGSSVTITGTGFGAAEGTVTQEGTVLSVVSWDPTSIVVTSLSVESTILPYGEHTFEITLA